MLYFNFARVFRLQGINKPFSHLVSKGYSEAYATRMTNNKVMEINCDRLEKFCLEFNCTPNDIFDFRASSKGEVPVNHALHSITKKDIDVSLIAKIDSLSAEKLQQVHALLDNME